MSTESVILSPTDYTAFIQKAALFVASRYCCMAAVDGGLRTRGRGTVVFLRHGDGHYLLTAKHVVDALFERPEKLTLIRSVTVSGPSLTIEHGIGTDSLVWASEPL